MGWKREKNFLKGSGPFAFVRWENLDACDEKENGGYYDEGETVRI
jgi:hypothetical protein